MLSPVGLPPQAPVPPDNDLVPALDRAIALPNAGSGSGSWQAGSLLSASVRYQNDEMILKVGDRFFRLARYRVWRRTRSCRCRWHATPQAR